MKQICILFFIAVLNIGYAQQKSGAVRTKQGVLLYFNAGQNSHTLDLQGAISLERYPLIKKDDRWFQFLEVHKSEFTAVSKNTLQVYMQWELDYVEKQLGQKLKSKTSTIHVNHTEANFWSYVLPKISNQKNQHQVKATYFLDLIHNDFIYRFTFASVSGDDFEAKSYLTSVARNLRFYENNINLELLQKNIIQGKNYY